MNITFTEISDVFYEVKAFLEWEKDRNRFSIEWHRPCRWPTHKGKVYLDTDKDVWIIKLIDYDSDQKTSEHCFITLYNPRKEILEQNVSTIGMKK